MKLPYSNKSETINQSINLSLSLQGLDCDFENSTFCGWENDNTGRAKFNWTIWSGETPSWSTGPRSDVSGSMTLTAYVRLM